MEGGGLGTRLDTHATASIVRLSIYRESLFWEFPGGPVVKTQYLHCCDPGSIPGQGTKIPKTVQCSKKKKKNYFALIIEVMGFPGSSNGKESACNAGDPSLIPGSGRFPGEGNGNPLQYSCLKSSMDSSWGHKESDTAE